LSVVIGRHDRGGCFEVCPVATIVRDGPQGDSAHETQTRRVPAVGYCD